MNKHTWRSIFGALNPSPLFEAIAVFAEELAIKDSELPELPAGDLHPAIFWKSKN